jgi:hypothetical protein
MSRALSASFRGCSVRGKYSGDVGLVTAHQRGSNLATVAWRDGREDTYDIRLWHEFLDVSCGCRAKRGNILHTSRVGK